MLITSKFLLLLSLFAISAADSELRVYSLSELLPRYDAGVNKIALLPSLMLDSANAVFLERSNEPQGPEYVLDFLSASLGQEFDLSNRYIALGNKQSLLVYAPPDVHAKVATILQALEKAFSQTMELTFDVISLSSTANLPANSAIIKNEEAERLLTSLQPTQRQTYKIQLRPGRNASLDLSKRLSFVSDYNVEVTTGSAIARPIIASADMGTKLWARGLHFPSGVLLDFVLQDCEQLEGVRTREIPIQSPVKLQTQLEWIDVAKVFQNVDVLTKSLALNTFVPNGMSLLIRSDLHLERANAQEVLLIRNTQPAGTLATNLLEIGGDANQWLWLNRESLQPPALAFEENLLMKNDDLQMNVSLQTAESDGFIDLLRRQYPIIRDNVRPWLQIQTEKTAEIMQFLHKDPTISQTISVAITLKQGGAKDTPVSLQLPLRIGQPSVAVLGIEGQYLFGYETHLAQDTSIPDPVVRSFFDGLALWLKPNYNLAGNLTVELRVRANLRVGELRQLDLGLPQGVKLDQLQQEQLLFAEQVVFSGKAGSKQRAVIGNLAGSSGLSLEIEIQ